MSKKLLCMVAAAAFISAAHANEPTITTEEKTITQDDKTYTLVNQRISFENGWFRYYNCSDNVTKEIIGKVGSEYHPSYFGLLFGQPPHSNGGWSIWKFLKLISMVEGKQVSNLDLFRAEKIYISQLKDCAVAEFVFPLSADGSEGKISVKAMQFPEFSDWIFFKVKLDTARPLWRMDLEAFPGTAVPSKERERWISTKEENFNVTKDGADFAPASNGLAIFSKFVDENFGNLIVFDASKYLRIASAQGADAQVAVQFTPNEGETEFVFALGYFSDSSPTEEVATFLNQNQPRVFDFMKKINWDPKVDAADFNRMVQETAKLVKGMGNNAGAKASQESLEKIQAGFKKAEAASDFSSCLDATAELRKLQEEISKAGLSQFH